MQQLVIIGGGPAGAAAALRARQLEADVTVVEQASYPRPRACTGWLGPSAVQLLTDLGLTAKQLGATPFSGVTLRSWDLASDHELNGEQLEGWLVDRATFDEALLKAAKKAGAKVHLGQPTASAEFAEDAVRVTLEDETLVEASVALLADGARSTTAGAAYITPAGQLPGAAATAYADFAAPKKVVALDVAVAPSRSGQVLTLARHQGRGRISLMTREPGADPRELLLNFARQAGESGLLPEIDPEAVQVGQSPAGLALDLDAHVGKRSLLVGDAGGFVGAFSNEGLFPAMRSGCLGAEVALQALQDDPLQDALKQFGPLWRQELAEYLRMPNTDLALLMPLVFKNAQMAERVARAFLCGVSF